MKTAGEPVPRLFPGGLLRSRFTMALRQSTALLPMMLSASPALANCRGWGNPGFADRPHTFWQTALFIQFDVPASQLR